MGVATLDEHLEQKLRRREQEGLMRALTPNRLPVDFFSNDYLGLARSGDLAEQIEKVHRTIGLKNGSTGSRLLSGNSSFAEEAECQLADVFQSESCLILNSGYAANLAVLSSIPQKGDTILYDQLAHASLKDGARLSLATRHSFRHNDMEDLEQKVKSAAGKVFIVVESIYSMDGDLCPLEDIVAIAQKHNAFIILDEAHSTGVLGPRGAGFSVAVGLHDKVHVRIYTFGKAMGVHGACISASQTVIRYITNFARPFIYTTAPSPHQVASISCAFKFLESNIGLQHILTQRIATYLASMGALANRTHSASAIQTLIVPGNEQIRSVSARLQDAGFDVRPILYPTVPKGTERLRICLHVFNTPEEISSLTSMLNSETSSGAFGTSHESVSKM